MARKAKAKIQKFFKKSYSPENIIMFYRNKFEYQLQKNLQEEFNIP